MVQSIWIWFHSSNNEHDFLYSNYSEQIAFIPSSVRSVGGGKFGNGCLRNDFFRHLTGVVVGDLPFSVFECVDKGVSGLHLVTSGAHGELIDTVIHAPVVSSGDVGFQDRALGFLLAEVNKVGSDRVVVRARDIRDSWQQARVGFGGVARGDLVRVKGSQSVVPQVEESSDFLVGDGSRAWNDFFRHLTRVVVGNLPLSTLEDVDERVSCLHLVTSSSKGEFINTDILAPVCSNGDEGLQNLSLRLLEQEGIEVIGDRGGIITGNVGDSWQQNTLGSVSAGDQGRITGGQGVIPQIEQALNFFLGDRGGNIDALWHDTGVVVGDLPLPVFHDVGVGVSSLHLGTTFGTHGEFVNSNFNVTNRIVVVRKR